MENDSGIQAMQPGLEDGDQVRYARNLYWQGWGITQIAKEMGLVRSTVESWAQRDGWKTAAPIDRVAASLDARIIQLIHKEKKTSGDQNEIDRLMVNLERLARVRRYEQPGGHEGDLNEKVNNRNTGNRKKPTKNAFTDEQVEALLEAFYDSLFGYQLAWYEVGQKHRIRNILKSRQVGATWYFAREALVDAIETGRNQIFLSASKAQAHIFKLYIIQFAAEVGVTLTGDPIVLANGATLYFLGTNAKTAQGYHGNFYFDEYFWVHGFDVLRKVASGMAMHKKWRQTFFSTPSAVTHEAYKYWSGSHYNRGRRKAEHIKIDTSHAALAGGVLCADGQWRQIVTIEDAIAGGCDLFDFEQLKLEYSALEWQNLLMCEFMDDSLSVFSLNDLMHCQVDSWLVWDDFQPMATRPFGYRQVWVGYDPALNGDSAGLVVIAPPLVSDGKFRILEKLKFNGMNFDAQAKAIEAITQRYTVTYIAIDVTGMGQGVFQLVKEFFPAVVPITYSAEVKSRLVLKAYDVIDKRRLEFDSSWNDLVSAFMSIRRVMTASGRQSTFEASRSEDTGHADLAWATMHALDHEPLAGQTEANTGFVVFSE